MIGPGSRGELNQKRGGLNQKQSTSAALAAHAKDPVTVLLAQLIQGDTGIGESARVHQVHARAVPRDGQRLRHD